MQQLMISLPPQILLYGLTYLAILVLVVVVCAAIRPQAIDVLIHLLDGIDRLLYHDHKRRKHPESNDEEEK